MGKRRIPHKLINDIEYKWCRGCQSWQPLSLFYASRRNIDGHEPKCSLCAKKWRQEHLEFLRERRKERYWANPEKARADTAKWILDNLEYHKIYKKQYFQNNKEYFRAKHREWSQKNEMNKYYSDINFRLSKILKVELRSAIRREWKKGKTLELLGCSIDNFKQYLEKQFDENMTWDNYGTYWHIDHKMPISRFNLSDLEQQKICFHYTNMQPLEALENIKKGNKI